MDWTSSARMWLTCDHCSYFVHTILLVSLLIFPLKQLSLESIVILNILSLFCPNDQWHGFIVCRVYHSGIYCQRRADRKEACDLVVKVMDRRNSNVWRSPWPLKLSVAVDSRPCTHVMWHCHNAACPFKVRARPPLTTASHQWKRSVMGRVC